MIMIRNGVWTAKCIEQHREVPTRVHGMLCAPQVASRLGPGGGTALYAGLEEGIRRLAAAPPSQTAVDAVFLCTDGEATVSHCLDVTDCMNYVVNCTPPGMVAHLQLDNNVPKNQFNFLG